MTTNVNNRGIIHAAFKDGGQPLCRSRRAHMVMSLDRFRQYPASQCKRCAVKLAGMDAVAGRQKLSDEIVTWPAGSEAWFICRHRDLVDDIMLPLKAPEASEAELARRGRMTAARMFKRLRGIHPSTTVECEFQFVETPAIRAALFA